MSGLPRVAIEKLLRDVVPEELTLQKEVVDWATECAAEFLRILGENANAVAEAGAKKEKYRVNADHVVQALQQMGMERYLDELETNGHDRLEANKQKKQRVASRKAALQTASRDELLAEQNALFQEASSKAARQGW